MLLGLLVNSGILDAKPGLFGISKKKIHAPEEGLETLELSTKFDRFDFVGLERYFMYISMVLLIAGAIMLSVFKLNLGIDFSSGTRVEILSKEALTAS